MAPSRGKPQWLARMDWYWRSMSVLPLIRRRSLLAGWAGSVISGAVICLQRAEAEAYGANSGAQSGPSRYPVVAQRSDSGPAGALRSPVFEYVSLKDFGAAGDGVTNDSISVQLAFDQCIRQNKALYVPPGTYLLDSAAGGVGTPIQLNFTSNGQSLRVFGKGRGLSIFKEKSGSVAAGGRYTRMFFLNLDASWQIDEISWADLSFDKNGASNGPERSRYGWEQSHVISIASSVWGKITPYIKTLSFVRTECIDKVGAFVNVSTQMAMGKVVVEDFRESKFSALFGERGDFEITTWCENITFNKVKARFVQTEPVRGYEAGVGKRKAYYFSDCDIGTIQLSEPDWAADYVKAEFTNVTCRHDFSTRGVSVNFSGGEMTWNVESWAKFGAFDGTTIRTKYDSASNAVRPIYVKRIAAYKQHWLFLKCRFIPNTDSTRNVNGRAIGRETQAKTGYLDDVIYEIRNCWFDPRFEGIGVWYGTGSANITGSTLNCWGEFGLQIGAFSTYASELILGPSNDYSGMAAPKVGFRRGNSKWRFEWRDTITLVDYQIAQSGIAPIDPCYVVRPTIMSDTSPATTNQLFFKGDRVYRPDREASKGVIGWECTMQGRPGIWKEIVANRAASSGLKVNLARSPVPLLKL